MWTLPKVMYPVPDLHSRIAILKERMMVRYRVQTDLGLSAYVFDNQIRMHICSCSRGSLTWGRGRHLPWYPKWVWPWNKTVPGQKRRPFDLWTDLWWFCCIPPRPKSTYFVIRKHGEPCIHPYWPCPNLMCAWQSSISLHFSESGLTKPTQYCLSLFGLSIPWVKEHELLVIIFTLVPGYTLFDESGTAQLFWYQCPTNFPPILISMSHFMSQLSPYFFICMCHILFEFSF